MLEAAIRWIGARARRQRGPDPRDGPQARQLGAQARRARRQARRFDRRRPAQADRRHADRPGPPGPAQDRGSARRARQRPPDQARNPRAGRGDEAANCSTTARSACGSTRCGRRGARRSSAPPATPTRRWPASSAKCCSRWAEPREGPAHPRRDQPVRPPRRGRHGGQLWQLDRQAGQRDGARLGRADHHRPARKRGRPRPPVYPHQRHAGRRPGRPDPARARHDSSRWCGARSWRRRRTASPRAARSRGRGGRRAAPRSRPRRRGRRAPGSSRRAGRSP